MASVDVSIDAASPRSISGSTASAYPSKDVVMSRRRRDLLIPFIGFLVSTSSGLLSSQSGFVVGQVIGIVAAFLCVYQCYRVLKSREAQQPKPQISQARSRCAMVMTAFWQIAIVFLTGWALLIGVVRVASYFEANLLERGECNWGCVRVSLYRSDHCDDFCNPLLLKTNQASVQSVVKRWLEEQPRTSVVRTIEKEATPKKSVEPGQNEDSTSPTLEAAEKQSSTQYTYGVSLSTLIGMPTEFGVETSCMPLPLAGNSTGVLVSIQTQQLFHVGFPDVDGQRAKVRSLLSALRHAADEGILPTVQCR